MPSYQSGPCSKPLSTAQSVRAAAVQDAGDVPYEERDEFFTGRAGTKPCQLGSLVPRCVLCQS